MMDTNLKRPKIFKNKDYWVLEYRSFPRSFDLFGSVGNERYNIHKGSISRCICISFKDAISLLKSKYNRREINTKIYE